MREVLSLLLLVGVAFHAVKINGVVARCILWHGYQAAAQLSLHGISTFMLQDPFMFSDRIDGSAISYTINYADTTSGADCGSTTIPALSCSRRICQSVFDLSSSSCPFSDSITVTVFGTNILSNGTLSPPVSTSELLRA